MNPSPSGHSPATVTAASQRTALLAMVGCQLITGTTYIVAKTGLREFSPFALGFWRFSIAGLLFLLLLWWRGEWHLPRRSDFPAFLVFAALGVPLNQGAFLLGIQRTPAAHGALLYATTPLVVFLLSMVLLKTRPNAKKAGGVILGFLGVLCVLLERGLTFSADALTGDLLIGLGVIFWSLYTILAKQLSTRYTPLYTTAVSMILGAILFFPAGLGYALDQDYTLVSRSGVFSVLYLAILTSLVSYLVWNWALGYLEAEKVAIVANLQPVVAAVIGWLVLGETVTLFFFLGAGLVVMGVWLTQQG